MEMVKTHQSETREKFIATRHTFLSSTSVEEDAAIEAELLNLEFHAHFGDHTLDAYYALAMRAREHGRQSIFDVDKSALPDLVGSEKQVTWASDIREKALSDAHPIALLNVSNAASAFWIDSYRKHFRYFVA